MLFLLLLSAALSCAGALIIAPERERQTWDSLLLSPVGIPAMICAKRGAFATGILCLVGVGLGCHVHMEAGVAADVSIGSSSSGGYAAMAEVPACGGELRLATPQWTTPQSRSERMSSTIAMRRAA